MSFSYDDTQLATSALYRTRLEIGDTDSTAPLLQDQEITQFLSVERTEWGCYARCCEQISRQFLRKTDVRIGRGGTTLTYTTAAAQYAQMAKDFRRRANGMNAPWAGGRSVDDKETLAQDPSLVQPIFSKNLMTNPLTGPTPSFIEDQD